MRTKDEEWDVMAVAFETTTSLKKYAIGLAVSIYIDRRRFISPARPRYPKRSSLLHAPLFPFGVLTHALSGWRGKLDEAKTYIPHCSLCRSYSHQEAGREATLWWDWAEMEWLNGEDDRAKDRSCYVLRGRIQLPEVQ